MDKAPSREEQYAIIEPFLKPDPEEGKTYYLIDAKWLKAWERYVDKYFFMKESPGLITNASLLGDSDTLRLRLESLDFKIISEQGWNLLVKWYSGGPPIPRKAVRNDW